MPRLWELGLYSPDPELRYDEAAASGATREPDWQELRTVVTGHGPKSQERLDFRRLNHEQTAWVRAGDPRAGRRVTILGRMAPQRRPHVDESGRLGAGADPDVWEVFRQEKDGDPMRHAGNVRAPDRELAMHYAREFYSRRNESVRLWVVPRGRRSRTSRIRTCSSRRSIARSRSPAAT